jgi:uncharacterized protein YndB with AHSA1/START domain
MSSVRAEILPVDFPNTAAARITIDAPASVIFDLLAAPAAHQRFDGSGSVKDAISGPERLYLGATFGMAMKIKVPYRIKNTVVEFEENKKITESFDASKIAAFPKWWLKRTGAMSHNPKWMAKSLVALKAICEG